MLYHTFPNMCFTEFHVSLPQLEDCKKVSEEKAIQEQEEKIIKDNPDEKLSLIPTKDEI